MLRTSSCGLTASGARAYHFRMLRRLFLALALLAAARLGADSWSLPDVETFHSADGRWRLVVTPKQLKGQLEYFSDKVAGNPDAGAVETVPANVARGELFRKASGGTWQRVARWRLVNAVAPVSALVANDGTVVTFDNWHSMGYGDDAVVIYRSDGTLIRKFGLADILEDEDILQLRRSVSSIWWSGTHRLDDEKRLLNLEIAAHKREVVPVSLDTGTALVPKRVMFPRPRVTWLAQEIGSCDGAVPLSRTELSASVVEADPPEYPPIARKARIAGNVVVDIWIDSRGAVERADVLKPLPFGLAEAAHAAIVKWRFRAVGGEGESSKRCGRVAIEYDLASFPRPE
jgi:TonB family protein